MSLDDEMLDKLSDEMNKLLTYLELERGLTTGKAVSLLGMTALFIIEEKMKNKVKAEEMRAHMMMLFTPD